MMCPLFVGLVQPIRSSSATDRDGQWLDCDGANDYVQEVSP